jgi:hypothetical protein
MITVVIAVPVGHLQDAGELAAALGLSEADRHTFDEGLSIAAQDAGGALYRVAVGLVSDDWPDRAQSELVERDWPVDLDAATRAQALVRVGEPAAPDVIAVTLRLDLSAALEAMGLVVA